MFTPKVGSTDLKKINPVQFYNLIPMECKRQIPMDPINNMAIQGSKIYLAIYFLE